MSQITFKVAARCERAGRPANQDSMMVWPNLTAKGTAFTTPVGSNVPSFTPVNAFDLSQAGSLLVVADGMGGMSSGEKASELVIAGLLSQFENLAPANYATHEAAEAFLRHAITYADSLIKRYAAQHTSSRGMGSTLAMVWMLGDSAIVAWVGDSRILRFNPANGLVRLSHDHSYVQALVDNGKIDPEEAFDHPDSNIITRSMGDSNEPVKPDIRSYRLYDGDSLVLCSDGLCGLLPEEEITDILARNAGSASAAVGALWSAGEKAGFSDNCTIIVADVTAPANPAPVQPDGYPEVIPPARNYSRPVHSVVATPVPDDDAAAAPAAAPVAPEVKADAPKSRAGVIRGYVIMALIIIAVAIGCWFVIPQLFSDSDRPATGGTSQSFEISPDAAPAAKDDAQGRLNQAPANPAAGINDNTNSNIAKITGQINNLYSKIEKINNQKAAVTKAKHLTNNQIGIFKSYIDAANILAQHVTPILSRLDDTTKGKYHEIQKTSGSLQTILNVYNVKEDIAPEEKGVEKPIPQPAASDDASTQFV